QWTLDGVALCTAASYQLFPTIVSDAAGGAIVARADGRSGTNDIYAPRGDGAGGPRGAVDRGGRGAAADSQGNATRRSQRTGGGVGRSSPGRTTAAEQSTTSTLSG